MRLFNRVLAPANFDKDAEGLVKHWDFEQQSGQEAAAKIVAEAGLEAPFKKLLK